MGADDSRADSFGVRITNPSVDNSSRGTCGVWLMQWVLGEQWCVLPADERLLRPLPSVYVVWGLPRFRLFAQLPEAVRRPGQLRAIPACRVYPQIWPVGTL